MHIHMPGRIIGAALPLLLLLSACTMPSEPGSITAELLIDGDNVRVNGEPANFGQRIRQGDLVTTGPASAARLQFSDGTRVHLDQNTDPIFNWSVQRLRIDMQIGLVAIIKGRVIAVVEVIDAVAELFARSRAAIEHFPDGTFRVDLFEGSVQLTRPAGQRPLAPGEFFSVTSDGEVNFGVTSRARLEELNRRIDKAWDFSGPVQQLPINPIPDWLRRRAWPSRPNESDDDGPTYPGVPPDGRYGPIALGGGVYKPPPKLPHVE